MAGSKNMHNSRHLIQIAMIFLRSGNDTCINLPHVEKGGYKALLDPASFCLFLQPHLFPQLCAAQTSAMLKQLQLLILSMQRPASLFSKTRCFSCLDSPPPSHNLFQISFLPRNLPYSYLPPIWVRQASDVCQNLLYISLYSTYPSYSEIYFGYLLVQYARLHISFQRTRKIYRLGAWYQQLVLNTRWLDKWMNEKTKISEHTPLTAREQ